MRSTTSASNTESTSNGGWRLRRSVRPGASLLAKLDLGQHSIDEIRSESSGWSILESPLEREQRKELAREKILERIIGRLDGVVWSLVSIHRPPHRRVRSNSKPSAFVYIETEGNRKLP